MRLIDADALIQRLDFCVKEGMGSTIAYTFKHMIDEAPTIEDDKPKGVWIGTEFDGYADGNPVYYEWECSSCGCVVEDEEPTWNFCPNCGADMRAEQSEPSDSEFPNNCKTCKHNNNQAHDGLACPRCCGTDYRFYEPAE